MIRQQLETTSCRITRNDVVKFVRRWLRITLAFGALAGGAVGLIGCAAFRPIEGIPARFVPNEVKAQTRSGKKTLDLSLLSQTVPRIYHLDSGDVLAVYIEGVLPRANEFPPINMPMQGEEATPALGYPIPVRPDGTISLPLLPQAITVRGLSLKEVEDVIRRAYTVDRKILQTGNERVWVILHKPRQYRILVIRQEGVETPMMAQPGMANLGALKRGTGRVVTLAAYKNDVLHALAETGGLPGLDAENTIYVIRSRRRSGAIADPNSRPQPAGPDSGWSLSPANPWAAPVCPPPAIPPMPEGGFQLSPLPNDTFPLPPIDPKTNEVPVPSRSPIPQTQPPNAEQNSAADPEPQTRFPAKPRNTGLQSALLDYEQGESPKRVTPMAFEPGRTDPSIDPSASTLSPESLAGMPPTHSAGDWPEVSAETWMGHATFGDPTLANQNVSKIPVRLAPGEQVQFTERDILLEDGDIVFIESRDTEIFYTGGLLGGGQYTLPRDYDLDVLGAIAIAQARAQTSVNRGTGGVTALNQDVTISASQAIILRQMPNGTQVPIQIDLYRAVRHPEERVLMQPGDYLVLQYKPLEAVGAFFERHLLEGALLGVASQSFSRGN